jgi:hypothetical protein
MNATPRDEEHDEAEPGDLDRPEGGSGSIGGDVEQQRQAGSYARDAEQDPELGRHRQAAE